MPNPATVESFMALVEAGQYVDAIERFYAANASMQENGDPPRVGRDLLVAGERRVMSHFQAIKAARQGQPLIAGDRVAIHWRFEFNAFSGVSFTFDEVAWQTWQGDKVAKETFFYDPRPMIAGLQ